VTDGLREAGVADDRLGAGMALLDRKSKLAEGEFEKQAKVIALDWSRFRKYAKDVGDAVNAAVLTLEQGGKWSDVDVDGRAESLMRVVRELHAFDVLKWCEVDFSIVRGLAYYTGTVFEVHEASGKERAIAGGGRYDGLVQLFGGPPTPAVGIAMGDVVLRNVLEDRGLLPDEKTIQERLRLRVDAFVISAKEDADGELAKTMSELRGAGLHARQSYKATRNVGKLLGDAGKCYARTAVILGDELKENKVAVKDMETQEQVLVNRDEVVEHVRMIVRGQVKI
jgi:histidyl-tRNA synthetase